jgi:hypothetical protein
LFDLVLRANEVWAGLRAIPIPDHATPRTDLRAPYPPTDGYRSFFSQNGRAVRDEWPLPRLAEKLTAFWEHSSSGSSQNWNKLVGSTVGELAGNSLFGCLFLSKVVGWLLANKLVDRLLRELHSRKLGLLQFWPFSCVFFDLISVT